MKKIKFIVLSILSPQSLLACTTCNSGLQEQIKTTLNYHNLSSVFITVLFIVLIILAISKIVTVQHTRRSNGQISILSPAPVLTSGMILGIGLGGFIDGIFLHQILQWHEMLSNEIDTSTITGKSVNMFWDGLFHIICLVAVCIGIHFLWKALLKVTACHSAKLVWSGLLSGWAIFNIIEGLVDHHLFKIHNVRETLGKQDLYNLSFIIYSILLLFLGWLLYRSELKRNIEKETTTNTPFKI
jgi:uncharacterized membrane protein